MTPISVSLTSLFREIDRGKSTPKGFAKESEKRRWENSTNYWPSEKTSPV
jgi:hypothetical protein